MCPYNAINHRAYTAISTPTTNPHQISKHHNITKLASSEKEKRKHPSCSQCKASSICAWNPFSVTSSIPSTPDQTRSPLYAQEISLTKATLVITLVRSAWISTKTATDGKALLVNVPFVQARTRNGNCAIYRARRLRRHRRGGSVGRCECYSPFPLLNNR